jgi:hypothetical protein
MRSALAGTLVLALVAVLPGLYAVEKEYQPGVILKVEQKAHTRVLYYLVNTPITQDDPYYEVSIRFKTKIYVGEYTPRHAVDTPPEEWQAGSTVQARLEKHHMFVKGPGGTDWDLVIMKRTPVQEEKNSPEPVPLKK